MDLVLAMSASGKGAVILLFTGVAAPIAGFVFRRVAGGWESLGKGPFAIEQQLPWLPRESGRRGEPIDPAIQAAEIRQMLVAKQERQRRRGERPIDVDAEANRLLSTLEEPAGGERQDEELRSEVRQLVLARNERRMRKGLAPLDVDAETERQLADLVGSS